MPMNEENILKKKDKFKGGPSEGWEKMEDTAVEAEKGAPLWNKGMEGVSTADHEPHGSDYVGGSGSAQGQGADQNAPASQANPQGVRSEERLDRETVHRFDENPQPDDRHIDEAHAGRSRTNAD